MDNQTDIGVVISTKIDKAIQSANLLNKKLKETQKSMKKLGVDSSSINRSLSRVNTSKIKNLSSDAKRASSSMGGLSKQIKEATNGLHKGFDLGKMYFMFNTLKPVMQGIGGIIEKSVDYTETVNLFANAMGDLTSQAMTFQDKLSEAFGTAQASMMNYQATYKNMLSALGGMSNDVTEKLSETLTLMSIDYASLYNVEMENSAQKFQSALSRQVRPIRSTSGYDITQNVLSDYLQQAGIYDKEVSDLSEIEKRLLIIYSLQQQMANSSAFGDFARTIESPANQLRVLQEQIQEVGRWLGSVFYGTIGKVLPYINGFIMAIKEAVKWLALFLGYSVEDYASSGQTYFDQAFGDSADSIDGVGDSVSDVNDKLDDTKKKTKEIKEQLSGLDELNVITSTSESSSGNGSSSDSGGLGSAGVDPRLLKAIGEYDDMLDKVRMKANDIRDRLIEWGKIVGGYVNENIFKPMDVSWNKYGESILSRFQSGFSNFGSIVEDAFGIVLKRLPESVESVSSLFFSLLDDLAIAFDGISKLFKGIWDNGGNVLFEQLIRLANAIIDLGTSINDNFVKPILKWFADDIAPTLGKVLGKILGLFGSLVGLLADVTKAFAENKNAVSLVCTALTTMFALYKGAQIVLWVKKWVDEFKDFKGAIGLAKGALLTLEDTKFGAKIEATFRNLIKSAQSTGSTFKDAKNILSSLWTTLTAGSTPMSNTASIFGKLRDMASTSTGAVGLFAKGLSALTSPLGLTVVGITAVSGVLMYLTRDYNGTTGATAEYINKLKDQQKELDNVTKKTQENQKVTRDKIATIDSEYYAVERAISKLDEMVDSNGKVNGSQEVAQNLIDQINSKLGTNITIQDGVIKNWKDEKAALDQTIESMKLKARVEAHYDAYVKALKQEKDLSVALSTAKRELASNTEKLNQKKERFAELTKKGASMTSSEVAEYKKLAGQISDLTTTNAQLEKNVKSAQKAFDTNKKSITDYDKAVKATSGDVKDMAKSIVADYEKMGNDSKATWKSMAQGLVDLTSKHSEYVKNNADMNSKEVKSNEEATNLIIQHMVAKAKKHGMTYDEMLAKLTDAGVKLNATEKAQLQEEYNNYVSNKNKIANLEASKWANMSSQTSIQMSKLNSYQKAKLDEALNMFQQTGDKSGLQYCQKLANALARNGGATDAETLRIIGQIESRARACNPNVKVHTALDWNSLSSVVNSISSTVSRVVSTITMRLPHFATGGFPEDGMFMANHGELVGKFTNGKTAVANNEQIVQGIQSGVYRAVKEAMGESNNNGNNVVQVYIGKKKIAEEVQNANKESLMKTGKVIFGT